MCMVTRSEEDFLGVQSCKRSPVCRRSMSLDGHSGTMRSWRCVIHLFVFLSTIDLSRGGCDDYFDIKEWAERLTDTITLVEAEDPEHILWCSVNAECEQRGNMCHLLPCFKRSVTNITCGEMTNEIVPYYHFMCLIADGRHKDTPSLIPEGCRYVTSCKVFSEASTVFDQTTLPPPPATTPTLPERTTATTTTTTLPPTTILPERTTATTTPTTLPPTTILPERTTTTTTTTLPERTTATTTVLPSTAAPPASVTNSAHEGSSDTARTDNTAEIYKKVLVISLVLNVVGPLTVCLCMRSKRRRDNGQLGLMYQSGKASSEAPPETEREAETRLVSVREDEV